MNEICLIVEFYKNSELVHADLHSAVMDDEFVYTDSFKVKVSDTSVIPEENYQSVFECEHRVIVVDDSIGVTDSRFSMVE